jgi:hypothetical protein
MAAKLKKNECLKNPEYEWVVGKGCQLKSNSNLPTQSKSVYKDDCTRIEETLRMARKQGFKIKIPDNKNYAIIKEYTWTIDDIGIGKWVLSKSANASTRRL